MQRYFFLLLFCCCVQLANAQTDAPKVFTTDIDHFWEAYDSVQATGDSALQVALLQRLYVNRGTPGLKAFMEARDYSAALWASLIRRVPRFWSSVRPQTLAVKNYKASIEASLRRLKALYPKLRPATMYFTIGGLRSGGTTTGDMVLIGTEIAAGTAETDVSEFPDKWLAGVFREQKPDNIVALNIHEFVHTQQREGGNSLLDQSIKEGAADFITELVMGEALQSNYLQYGRAHEAVLKEAFKKEMFSGFSQNWLYNGSRAATVADLGYFMGYAICKAYYDKASNKKKAVRDIIGLNYSRSSAVEAFLERSGYYAEPLDKRALLAAFEAQQPVVSGLRPFANGAMDVDTALQELTILFSAPMNPRGYSINNGERGRDYSPITGVTGFSSDGRTFTLKVELKPAHDYEFVLTNRSFCSAGGYPLKSYTVKFRTR